MQNYIGLDVSLKDTHIWVLRDGGEIVARGCVESEPAIVAHWIFRHAPQVSQTVAQAIRNDFAKIPAEIIADHIMAHVKGDGLFRLARSLELRAFSEHLLGFDDLPAEEKAFLGMLLDFTGTDRASVAKSWTSAPAAREMAKEIMPEPTEELGPLFGTRKSEKINKTGLS